MPPYIGLNKITPFQSNRLNYSKGLNLLTVAVLLLVVSIILTIKTQIDCTKQNDNILQQQKKIEDLIKDQETYKATSSDLQKMIQSQENDSILKSTTIRDQFSLLNIDIAVLKEKVVGLEKTSSQFIDYILKFKQSLTEDNQLLTKLEQSFQQYEVDIQKFKSDFSELNGKVEGIEKTTSQFNNQINQQGNQTQINLNNADTLLKFQTELEYVKSQIISINQDLFFQFNKTQSNINTISTSIQSLPSLSTDLYQLSGVVNSLSQQVPALNKTISALDFKVNTETLTIVELLGPFIPKYHSSSIQLSIYEYKILQTTEPCIFGIKGKAVVSVFATGHAFCYFCESQLIFMINRNESNIKLNDSKWAYQSHYVNNSWLPVNLAQEFIIENQDHCEITLAIKKYSSEGMTAYLNGISFSVKITYIQ